MSAQHCHDTRERRVPQRSDRADPVRTADDVGHARPLLIVPPCINKYYILDLRRTTRSCANAVAQGHTTFIISWRNIPPELGHLTWDDYLERACWRAIRVARRSRKRARSTRSASASAARCWPARSRCSRAPRTSGGQRDVPDDDARLRRPGRDRRVRHARIPRRARAGARAGQRLHGGAGQAFATLRANDLVWNYVVNNYLKGETPPAFDLLYWNGDSANLPGPMYAYYLRELYLDNRLREPDALDAGRADRPFAIDMPTTSSQRATTTSCRGAPRTAPTGLLGGGRRSCSAPPAISPAS